MKENYNTMEFIIDRYTKPKWNEPDEEEIDYDALFEDVKSFVQMAIKNEYQLRIWSDDTTVVVEDDFLDECMSDSTLVWLGEDEYVAKDNGEEWQ